MSLFSRQRRATRTPNIASNTSFVRALLAMVGGGEREARALLAPENAASLQELARCHAAFLDELVRYDGTPARGAAVAAAGIDLAQSWRALHTSVTLGVCRGLGATAITSFLER